MQRRFFLRLSVLHDGDFRCTKELYEPATLVLILTKVGKIEDASARFGSCHMPRRVLLITFTARLHSPHPPNYQLIRFRQQHALQAMYDEIIPDSEPEREDQRRDLNVGTRRVKRTRKRQAADSTRSMSLVPSSSPEPDLSALFNLFLFIPWLA